MSEILRFILITAKMKSINCYWIVILLFVILPYSLAANDSIPPKKNLSLIKLANGNKMKGYIVGVSDNSIDVLSKKNYNRMQYAKTEKLVALVQVIAVFVLLYAVIKLATE